MKTVHYQVALPSLVILGALSAFALGGAIAIPVIDVGSAFGELPYTAILPLVAVIAIGTLVARTSTPSAASSSRTHPVLLTLFALISAGLYTLSHCFVLWAFGTGSDLGAARNMIAYTALLFLGQAVLGVQRAPLVPVVYVVVATIFGRIRGEIQPWAWPALPAQGVDLVVASLMLTVAAVFVTICARRFTENFYGLSARL